MPWGMHAEMYEKNPTFKYTRTGYLAWRIKKQDCHNQDKRRRCWLLVIGQHIVVNTHTTTTTLVYSSLCILHISLSLHPSHYIGSGGKNDFSDS